MSWLAGMRGRTRQEVLWGAIMLGGLSAFVVVTYVVIVLGGGALIGRTDAPDLGLSVLATAVVALAFDPVQTRLEHFASRTVKGGDPAPYDVLRRLSGTATGGYPAEELPVRMARVLAEAPGRPGRRCGWSSTTGRRWPRPGRRERSRWPSTRGPTRSAPTTRPAGPVR